MRVALPFTVFTRCLAVALAAVLVLTTAHGIAQSNKPNFSGRWKVDTQRSSGPGRLVEESIEHDESRLVITTTSVGGNKFAIRLSTDGKENLNVVGGREMTSQTTWDGNKLVTTVRDAQGMQFTEVRSLSEDGNLQTTEGFMGPGRTRTMFKRVAVKKE